MSTDESTVKYELIPNTVGVMGGYFAMENRDGYGIIKQLKGIDREEYSKMTLNIRALDASGNPVSQTKFMVPCNMFMYNLFFT